MVLDSEERIDFFWEFSQDGSQPGSGAKTWQDSGAVVTGMAGTATLVSTTDPFFVGLQVRIEGVEMTVTSITPGQWLVLDPYRISTTGAVIEIFGPVQFVTHEEMPVSHDGEGVTHV